MTALHSLLNRQIRRHLGTEASISEPWVSLIRAVDDAYRQGDEDRALLERALEISSQELMQANSQTRAMLQATPNLSLRVAFDGTVLEYKPSPLVDLFCSNAVGDSPGRRLVLRPDFLEHFQSSLDLLLQGKPMATFEIEPDGAPGRLFETRIVTLSSNQTVVVIRDITEERAAEAALRQALEEANSSEERLRVVARVSSDAIWDWDIATDRVRWNEGLTILLGYLPHEVETAESWASHIDPQDRERVMNSVQAVLEEGGISWSDEYHYQRKDGTFAYLLDRAHVIRDAAGNAVRIIGGMTDLTQRRAVEEKVAQQAALIDEARDAIVVRDLDHRIIFWSKGAERIYGWPAAEAVGRHCHELTDVDRVMFEDAVEVVLQEGEWSGEMARRSASGASLTVNSRWTLMRDGQGRPKSIFSIETDVTERKKLELQFLRAQRLESIGTLSGGIAHDLNNLLLPITMGVALLKHYEPEEKSLKVIRNIERSAKRGADLVRQMLSFARGAEGSRESVRLDEIVAEVQSIAENTFPKNVHFETDISGDLWPMLADPTQIHQVLLNLCVNARDAMPGGGRISLSARNAELDAHYAAMHGGATAGSYVVLRVADNGAGMTKEVLDQIFEPFFTTKGIGKGTGLGLSTTLGIIRGHHGFVDVSSEPGKGSTIDVYLPANLERAGSESFEQSADLLPRGDGETIMIVDDEIAILDITRQTLESFGYKVITAEDGAEAIALYAMHRSEIAVILADMMMPVMDGTALIAATRRIDPGVKIVVASGNDANASAAKAGVPHFLAKPFTAEVLLRTLSTVLDKERRPGAVFDGDVRLSLAS
jgi:PAS domain S-box-containing protein